MRADSREVESWYYLKAPYTTKTGIIQAAYNKDANTIEIRTTGVEGEFSILLNEEMVDFSQPVKVFLNEEEHELTIIPDKRVLWETTFGRGDPYYQFEAEITFHE